MIEPRKPRKTGRPALKPEDRRLPSMSFRPTRELREKLEQASMESIKSLSQEIERRLERSFQVDQLLSNYEIVSAGIIRSFGSTEGMVFGGALFGLFESIEILCPNWREESIDNEIAVAIIARVVQHLGPEKDAPLKPPHYKDAAHPTLKEVADKISALLAAPLLRAIPDGKIEGRRVAGSPDAETIAQQLRASADSLALRDVPPEGFEHKKEEKTREAAREVIEEQVKKAKKHIRETPGLQKRLRKRKRV